VVHDKDHRRVGRHRRQRIVVDGAQPYPVEGPGDAARQPVTEAKVDVGVEGGHDLARIAFDPVGDLPTWQVVLGGEALRLGGDLGVVEQTLDERLTAVELERLDADLQPRVHLIEDTLDTPPQQPADRWRQKPVDDGDDGEHRQHHNQPERQSYRIRHEPSSRNPTRERRHSSPAPAAAGAPTRKDGCGA
jgi:hypothetical protein